MLVEVIEMPGYVIAGPVSLIMLRVGTFVVGEGQKDKSVFIQKRNQMTECFMQVMNMLKHMKKRDGIEVGF